MMLSFSLSFLSLTKPRQNAVFMNLLIINRGRVRASQLQEAMQPLRQVVIGTQCSKVQNYVTRRREMLEGVEVVRDLFPSV
jgi:hypothetical protein